MLFRLHKALFAFVLALSFILNGSAMQAAHAAMSTSPPAMRMANDAMPYINAADAEKHHPCCPQQNHDKTSCTADCCTSVIPVIVQADAQFTFVQYKWRPKPALVLSSRTSAPLFRPPQV